VLVFWTLYLPVIFAEEAFLQARHGSDYVMYCSRVLRVLPRLRAAQPGQGTFEWSNLRKEHLSVTGTLSAVLAVKALEPQAHYRLLLVSAGLLLIGPHVVEKFLKRVRHSVKRDC